MPHAKFGKVGFLLGGGGCYEGLPQAIQISEFIRTGIKPDSILGVSVGTLNAIHPERAAEIWEDYFPTHWAIYDLHPEIRKLVEEIFDTLPHWIHWKTYESWKDFFRDLKIQSTHLIKLLRFGGRVTRSILRSLSSENKQLSLKGGPFFSLLRPVLAQIQSRGLHRVSLLDLSPLFETIQRVIDFEDVLNDECTRYFLARHCQETHIFTIRPSASFLEAYDESLVHTIDTKENLVAVARAATALPPFFDSVIIDGKEFWDAGALAFFPVEYLFADGCDTVFAFCDDFSNPIPRDDTLNCWFEDINTRMRNYFSLIYGQAQIEAERRGKKLSLITPHHPNHPIHPDLQLLRISPEAIEHTKRVQTEAMQRLINTLLS